jgi:hypothetical protein
MNLFYNQERLSLVDEDNDRLYVMDDFGDARHVYWYLFVGYFQDH